MKELIRSIEKRFPDGFDAVGADAMRWTLVFSITEGERVRLSLDRFTEGRNFVTKLWNGAGRVIQALAQELEREEARDVAPAGPTDKDRWLLARLDSTIRDCRAGRFHPANSALTHELLAKMTLGISPDEMPRWG